eukprot:6486214-Amphidinium_carterae.1
MCSVGWGVGLWWSILSVSCAEDSNQKCAGGTECTYRTRKAVLAQLGFSALTPKFPDFTDKAQHAESNPVYSPAPRKT